MERELLSLCCQPTKPKGARSEGRKPITRVVVLLSSSSSSSLETPKKIHSNSSSSSAVSLGQERRSQHEVIWGTDLTDICINPHSCCYRQHIAPLISVFHGTLCVLLTDPRCETDDLATVNFCARYATCRRRRLP